MTNDDRLRAKVLAAAAASRAPTRGEGRRRGAALTAVSIACALAIFLAIGGVRHSQGRPAWITATVAGGWTLVAAGLTWLSVGRGGSTLSRRPALLVGAALGTPAAMLAWMHAFAGTYVEPVVRVGWRCLGYTLAMTLLPVASFLWLRRGSEPRAPAALGAAIGVTAGAWAGVLVDLWCPLTNAPHVLVGHVLPLVAVAILGALAGRRSLAPPARR